MDLQKTREAIVRRYIEAYNQFDVEGMLRDLHPYLVFENISGGEVNMALNSIDEFRRQAREAAQLFSSREQQIVHLSARGDTVEVAIRYRGVLAADLPNGLKKGDVLELEGKTLFQFEGNQIIRLTDIS